MRSRRVVVVGAGGHAKVAFDVLADTGLEVTHFVTKDGGGSFMGRAVISEANLQDIGPKRIRQAFPAIGDNAVRLRLATWLQGLGFSLPTAISSFSHVSRYSHIGVGCLIAPGVVVNSGTVVGDFSILNTNSSVDHDCVLGRACHIAPGATLAGGVSVGAFGLVGTGSSVRPNVLIGESAIIGAGSVVVSDIPCKSTAFGNPARLQGYHQGQLTD
jgi:UDP-perosamine 4-acetyltransferase